MASAPPDLRAQLGAAQFFQRLSADDREKVIAIASSRRAARGEILFREGENCETLHIVSAGLVALDMCMPRRGCTRILTVGPGELLGWSALLGEGIMTARASAVEETELIALPARDLRQLCEEDHDIGYAIMQQTAVTLSRRLLAARLQTLDVYRETLPAGESVPAGRPGH